MNGDKLTDEILRALRVADHARENGDSTDLRPRLPPDWSVQRDFGFGIIILSVFTLILSCVVPEDYRWMFFLFSFLLLFVGAWKIDRPQRSILRRRRLESTVHHS